MFSVLVIPISTPLLVGVYDENNILIETFSKDGKTSDILPDIFKNIFLKYDLSTIYYVNGPGSYMSIKVAYIFLKTLCITKELELKAASGFKFNQNSPIKALGKKYFFNSNDDICNRNIINNKKSQKLQSCNKQHFNLKHISVFWNNFWSCYGIDICRNNRNRHKCTSKSSCIFGNRRLYNYNPYGTFSCTASNVWTFTRIFKKTIRGGYDYDEHSCFNGCIVFFY